MQKLAYQSFIEDLQVKNVTYSQQHNKYELSLPIRYPCPRIQSCLGGLAATCAEGYKGPLCAVCQQGFYKMVNGCLPCPSKTILVIQIILVVLVVIVFASFVTVKAKKKPNKERSTMDIAIARLKILIGFYQVMTGTLEGFGYIKLPPALATMVKYAKFIQLNILQIAPLECFEANLKVDLYLNMTFSLTFVLVVIVCGLMVYNIRYLTSKTFGTKTTEASSEFKASCLKCVLMLLFLVYPSTSGKVFAVLPLSCHKLCSNAEQSPCPSFLTTDYSQQCFTSRHTRYTRVAYFGLIFSFGFPVVSFFLLWKYYYRIIIKAKRASKREREMTTSLSFLYENYTTKAWFWEIVELLRKLILTSAMFLIGTQSRTYVGIAALFSGLYTILHALYKPIPNLFEYWLQLTSLFVTFINLMVGLILKIPDDNIVAAADKQFDALVTSILLTTANFSVTAMIAGIVKVRYFGIKGIKF